MKQIRDELMKTTLGRCVWVIFLITVGSWILSMVYNLIVFVISAIAGLLGIAMNKRSNVE